MTTTGVMGSITVSVGKAAGSCVFGLLRASLTEFLVTIVDLLSMIVSWQASEASVALVTFDNSGEAFSF